MNISDLSQLYTNFSAFGFQEVSEVRLIVWSIA
jgi:hypothetical protein